MAQTKGPEAAIQAVVNTLNSYLAAQITAESAAWNDTVTLPPIKQVYAMWRSLIPLSNYPCVVVSSLPDGGKIANDAAGAAGWGWHTVVHRLEVTALVRSNDVYTLEAQSLRYLHALQETLGQHPGLDGSLMGTPICRLRSYGRSAVYRQSGKQPILEGVNAGWVIEVEIQEVL